MAESTSKLKNNNIAVSNEKIIAMFLVYFSILNNNETDMKSTVKCVMIFYYIFHRTLSLLFHNVIKY